MNIPVACFLIYLLCLFQRHALFISNCVFSHLQLSFSEFLTRPFALLLAVSFVNFSHVLSYCQSSPFPVETASFPNFKRVLSQFERHYFLVLTTPFFSPFFLFKFPADSSHPFSVPTAPFFNSPKALFFNSFAFFHDSSRVLS